MGRRNLEYLGKRVPTEDIDPYNFEDSFQDALLKVISEKKSEVNSFYKIAERVDTKW